MNWLTIVLGLFWLIASIANLHMQNDLEMRGVVSAGDPNDTVWNIVFAIVILAIGVFGVVRRRRAG